MWSFRRLVLTGLLALLVIWLVVRCSVERTDPIPRRPLTGKEVRWPTPVGHMSGVKESL